MSRIQGDYADERHSHANWTSGHDAFLAGQAFNANEHQDWVSGYLFAQQSYSRDWWAIVIAGSITASLLMIGVSLFAVALMLR